MTEGKGKFHFLKFLSKDVKWILINKVIYRERYKESKIPEYKVKKRIKKINGDLFVDIGTNHKDYAKLLEKNFNRIITIDPNPKWDADMQIAISNFNGHSPFYIWNDEGSADSIIQNPHILGKTYFNDSKYDVEVKTFDSLELNTDLVKIDVEGAEFDVLEGMKKYIPKVILVELHDERRKQDLINKLSNMNYNVTMIDETHFLGKQKQNMLLSDYINEGYRTI